MLISRADKIDGSGKVEGIGTDGNFLIKRTKLIRGYNGKPILPAQYEAVIHDINPSTLEHSFDDGVNWYSEEDVITRLEKYSELIYAVESIFQDESRHETALRYITQHENQTNSPVMYEVDKELNNE